MKELQNFLEEWKIDPLHAKSAFLAYKEMFENNPAFKLAFVSRPGISRSLRIFANSPQNAENIVALIDVVDDDPENRWLSVCFFADRVTDPEELGDYVPEGLEGKDAVCFNLDEDNSRLFKYIGSRLHEAAQA